MTERIDTLEKAARYVVGFNYRDGQEIADAAARLVEYFGDDQHQSKENIIPMWVFARERTRLLKRENRTTVDKWREHNFRYLPYVSTTYMKAYGDYAGLEPMTVLGFPEPSTKTPGHISFYRDLKSMIRDIRVEMSAGKFFKHWFPEESDETIRMLAEKAKNTNLEPRVQFIGPDPVLWKRAYRTGPSSCMSRPTESYKSGCHPTAVYSYPDNGILLAVLLPPEHPGLENITLNPVPEHKVLARAIVTEPCDDFPEAPLNWVRIYPDSGYPEHQTLKAALEKMGYYQNRSALEGRKIRYITNNYGATVLPYIDWENAGVESRTPEPGTDYLVISDGNEDAYKANHETGLVQEAAEEEETEVCADCGGDTHPDDMFNTHGDRRVCSQCIGDYTEVQTGRQHWMTEYVHDDEVVVIDGNPYWVDHDDVIIRNDGEYDLRDNCVRIDGEWYSSNDDDIVLLENGDYYFRDECVQIGDEWYQDTDPGICIPEDDKENHYLTTECVYVHPYGYYTDTYSEDNPTELVPHPDSEINSGRRVRVFAKDVVTIPISTANTAGTASGELEWVRLWDEDPRAVAYVTNLQPDLLENVA